jgi:hypothetical protein
MQEGVYLLFEAIEGVVVESYWLTRRATLRFWWGRRDGGVDGMVVEHVSVIVDPV